MAGNLSFVKLIFHDSGIACPGELSTVFGAYSFTHFMINLDVINALVLIELFKDT